MRGSFMRDARNIRKHVYMLAKLLSRGSNRRLHIGLSAYIRAMENAFGASCSNLFGCGPSRFSVDICRDYLRAFLGEERCDRFSNSHCRARNQRYATFQTHDSSILQTLTRNNYHKVRSRFNEQSRNDFPPTELTVGCDADYKSFVCIQEAQLKKRN